MSRINPVDIAVSRTRAEGGENESHRFTFFCLVSAYPEIEGTQISFQFENEQFFAGQGRGERRAAKKGPFSDGNQLGVWHLVRSHLELILYCGFAKQ